MKNKLIALLGVRSIVTILLTITFVTLAIMGVIPVESFVQAFLMVMTFYFVKRDQEENKKKSDDKE